MSTSRRLPASTLHETSSYLPILRSHLEPTPILKALPTALQLFAHFQLLSRRIIEQATEALRIQADLTAELEDEGVPLSKWVKRGALSREQGRKIKAWSRRDEGDVMFGLSLEVRKHHIAKVLSSMYINPRDSMRLINCYFPDTSTDLATHDMLFIRCMGPDQVNVMGEYRTKVKEWYKTAVARYDKNRGPPALSSLVGDAPAERFQLLVSKIIREAERCLADAEEFKAMFDDSVDFVEGSSVAPDNQQTDEEEMAARRKARRVGDPSCPADRNSTQQTLPSQASQTAAPKQTKRPRASLPVHVSRRSLSPTPEHLASLPRVNFGKRPAVSRISLDRSITPISPIINDIGAFEPEPLFAPGPSSDILEDPPLEPPTRRSGPPPIFAPRSIVPSSGLKSSYARSPQASTSSPAQMTSSRIAKKRLSGTGRGGPDYTAPLPTPKRSPEQMKPFSSAELHAGKRKSLLAQDIAYQDENSPRQAKKNVTSESREALGSGESQENSQESERAPAVTSRDKGKQRAIPNPMAYDLEVD